ncbi:FUSC family membrane protein, partial [Escherichia sp. R-CC3]
YQHDPHFERAFTHIDAALERMRDNGAPADLLKTLGFLLNNLRAIDAQLATIESEQAQAIKKQNSVMMRLRKRPASRSSRSVSAAATIPSVSGIVSFGFKAIGNNFQRIGLP